MLLLSIARGQFKNKDNDSKKQLLNELEGNLYDKIENAEFEGFKG